MRKIRFSCALALASLVLAALFGCEKKAPSGGPAGDTTPTTTAGAPASTAPAVPVAEGAPAAGAPAASALKIPAPAPLDNPDVFVMARLRDPNKFLDRLGEWIATVQPMMNAEMLRNQVAMMGLDLKELRAGENLGVFVLAPAAQGEEPATVGLLPIGPKSQTIATLGQRMGDAVTTVGEYALVGPRARATALAPALIELNKTPALSDIQAYLNVAVIMEKYGPALTQKIQGLQMFVASMAMQRQGAGPDQAGLIQQALAAEIQGLLDTLNKLQFVNVGLDLGSDRLELSALFRGKPGSEIEKALSKPAPPDLDLAAYVSPEGFIRGQMTIRDVKGLIDIYLKYLGLILGPGQQAAVDKLKTDLAPLDKVGTLHYGVMADVSPEGKLVEEMVAKCDNNDAFMDLANKKVTEWINGGALYGIYKQLGLEVKMISPPQTRKLDGIDVTHYAIGIDVTSATAPQQRQQMQKMLGQMEVEIAKVGDFVAITLGVPIDALAKRIQARQAGQPLASKQAYPAGGVFYMDVSMAGLMRIAKASAPAEQAAAMPSIPASVPPLTMAGYHADGMGWYRFGLSRELLKAVVPQQPQQGPTPIAPVPPSPQQ